MDVALRMPGRKRTSEKLSFGPKLGRPLNVTSKCDAQWTTLAEWDKTNKCNFLLKHFNEILYCFYSESHIAEMCHTNHVNNTIESTHAHIISPGYAGSFAQNNNKCHLTLLSIAEYQYTRFTLYSIEFHIQPLDPTLDECCEESVQYVKIRIFRADESVETLYFCGQAQVNVSYVATRVDVTFKREAIGLPGFHIIYTGKYDPL